MTYWEGRCPKCRIVLRLWALPAAGVVVICPNRKGVAPGGKFCGRKYRHNGVEKWIPTRLEVRS